MTASAVKVFPRPTLSARMQPLKRLELVDRADGSVALEVVERLPDCCLLVAGAVVGKHVLVDLVEELGEEVVEDQEVDALGRVLGVDRGDVVVDGFGDVVELVLVVPDLIEELDVLPRHRRVVDLGDHVRDGVAALVAEIRRGESVQREVRGVSSTVANCCIGAPVLFDRKRTLRRTQSAHSRAMARWVSLFRSRISKSDP